MSGYAKAGDDHRNVGAAHGMAKLDDEQVRQIRERYNESGVSQKKLADEYGVSRSLIGLVVTGKMWRHVT